MKKLIFALFALASTLGFAQTTVAPITNPRVQFFNNSVPCAGCLLDTFSAGTTNALVTYSESTGTTPNANPVVLGSDGSAVVYLTSASYKFRLRTAAGATLWTQDSVTWSSPLSTFAGITSTGNVLVKPSVAATGGANQSSPTLCISGFYFNVTSLTDQWCLSDTLGTGTSPTSTFALTHSGSGGTALLSLPTLAPITTTKINQTITVQSSDTGADMCAKIQNKINALPTGSGTNQGGIIDATSFTGDQACASTLTLGVANQSIVLYLGLVRIISQAAPVIKCPSQVSCNIFGAGNIAGAASNNTGGTQFVHNGASNDAFDWFGAQGTMQNVTIVSASAGVSLFVKALAGSGKNAQQNVFMNISFSGPGFGTAGSVGIQLQSNSPTELSTENVFTGISLLQYENDIKMTTTGTQGPTDNWFNGISILGGSPGGTCVNIQSGDINWFTGGILSGCATGVITGATATQNAFAIRLESNTLNINNAGIGTMFVPANLDANTITDTGTNTVILGAAQVNIVQKIGNGGSLQVPLLNSSNAGSVSSPSYAWSLDTGTGMWNVASDHSIRFSSNGTNMFELVSNQARIGGSGGVAGFTSTADPSAAGLDSGISRLGAALIGIGNGTAGDFSGGIQEKLHRFSETTAPSALSTVDICYGDSTAHKLECAYNNGSFFPMTQTVGSGTAVMTTALIAAGACGTTVTVAATGVLTTDVINAARNAAATNANGGNLNLNAWPTANNANFNYCNQSAAGVTPGAMTINWSVTR